MRSVLQVRLCAAMRGVVVLAVVAWLVCGSSLVLAGQQSAPAGGKTKAKVAKSPGVQQAALAARLALQGEKMQSPILLLAAAELLGQLRESGREAEGVKAQLQGTASSTEKEAPGQLSVRRLVELARRFAGDDAELKQFIDSRLERLRSRGLIYGQGKKLPTVKLRGHTFKVLEADVLGPGQTFTAWNVIFEGRRPAAVVVVGDGDGDLDLYVYDDDSGGLIGLDDDTTSFCVVEWTPRWEGPFRIKVTNVGSIAERFVVLVNW